jgi:DNA polymerase-3 subunit alpha (Gram-positive type)
LIKQSIQDEYVVGSRGSVGSSLVATMLNITDVNPLSPHYICSNCKKTEFVNDKDDGFDLEIKKCDECNADMHGEGHNIPFETFLGFKFDKIPDIDLNFSGEYQNKAHDFLKKQFGEKNTFRAGTISTIADKTSYGYVRAYFEEKYPDIEFKNSESILYRNKCRNVKRTTGQHPGGILVVPTKNSIFEFTPYNYPADDTNQS